VTPSASGTDTAQHSLIGLSPDTLTATTGSVTAAGAPPRASRVTRPPSPRDVQGLQSGNATPHLSLHFLSSLVSCVRSHELWPQTRPHASHIPTSISARLSLWLCVCSHKCVPFCETKRSLAPPPPACGNPTHTQPFVWSIVCCGRRVSHHVDMHSACGACSLCLSCRQHVSGLKLRTQTCACACCVQRQRACTKERVAALSQDVLGRLT
jgi:hypothetical protein